MRARLRLILVLAISWAVNGCQTIGPGTIPRDRLDYAGAIAGSWREQTLLNIVKLRYFDAPVFLEVSSVISSYTLQGEVSVEAQAYPFSTSTGANNSNRRLGVSGTYTDRPTISYTPVTGERYIEKLLRPIPPQAIFAMIQAGHQADYILALTVRAINDVYNYSASPARRRREDPAFYAAIEALRRIQLAGALGVRIEKDAKAQATVIFFREKIDPEVEKDIRLLKETLGINPESKELTLGYGSAPRASNEITLLTRSMWEILAELSAGVEVPEQDTVEGRATATPRLTGRPAALPIAHIHASTERPADAYIAARYRDRWFWIDDRDLASKRIFTFLMVFSSIAETGAVPQVPVLTIPAN
jgi:hypothetical protein